MPTLRDLFAESRSRTIPLDPADKPQDVGMLERCGIHGSNLGEIKGNLDFGLTACTQSTYLEKSV